MFLINDKHNSHCRSNLESALAELDEVCAEIEDAPDPIPDELLVRCERRLAAAEVRVDSAQTAFDQAIAAKDRATGLFPTQTRSNIQVMSETLSSGDQSTYTGQPQDRTHTLSRVLRPAIRAANTQLEEDGQVPIPIGSGRGKSLNQHGLRHTHISLRLALGDDLMRIASDVGHESIEVTMRVYTHLMSLDERSRQRLAEIVNGGQ